MDALHGKMWEPKRFYSGDKAATKAARKAGKFKS